MIRISFTQSRFSKVMWLKQYININKLITIITFVFLSFYIYSQKYN